MRPTASASSTDLGTAGPRRGAIRFSRLTRAVRWARRITFLLHRWLGIALALLMAMWTLSGIVMMYVSFPATSAEERARGLEPLDLSGCCAQAGLPAGPLENAAVEMMGGRPVLRWGGVNGGGLLDLASGREGHVGAREAGRIAAEHMRRSFGSLATMTVVPGGLDQWTVYGQFKADAPLYKVTFADARGTVLYVSGKNGEVVQDTNARERFWNWLGAVPHWLYFTAIRQNGALWSNVVIYASLLGTFLTLTGLYVGLRMYGRGPRRSPFRGVAMWHHWTGLIFGVVTLTWVFSGFASMQPWGWLESSGPGEAPARLAGRPLDGQDVATLISALAAHPQPRAVSAEVTVQAGRPWAILTARDGSRTRASLPDLAPAPPANAELAGLAALANPGLKIASQNLIREGDAYHYSHHSTPAVLPAWRVIYGDAQATRLYFDPRTAEPIDFVDSATRQFRWWHSGLHRLDLSGLRERPLWDAVMLVLLAGVAAVCLLGAWMGWRRLTRRERGSKRPRLAPKQSQSGRDIRPER